MLKLFKPFEKDRLNEHDLAEGEALLQRLSAR